MAMSQQPQAPASLANNTAANITGYESAAQANQRLVVRVAADQPFRLNLLATADPDVPTNYVAKQIASSTVSVDGATAGYTNVAEFSDIPMAAAGKVQIYNASGSTLNWVADWRIYE